MPYPMPFLPVLVIAILISAIFPTLLKLCSRLERDDRDRRRSQPTEARNPDLLNEDPFSDRPGARTAEVVIEAKFVEFGSRPDELSFDWIVPLSFHSSRSDAP